MLSMSLWKECDMFEVWEFNHVNWMLGCLLFKKFRKFNESCSLSKAVGISSTCLKNKI